MFRSSVRVLNFIANLEIMMKAYRIDEIVTIIMVTSMIGYLSVLALLGSWVILVK